MAKGKPAPLAGLVKQPLEHLMEHYNGGMRGWYNYYQLAENVGRLKYARDVWQYSRAKPLARKDRHPVAKVFRKSGTHLTVTKPNGRAVCFFNAPLVQGKKAKTKAAVDVRPPWGPRRTQTGLLDSGASCGNGEQVEMPHVRHLRTRGQSVRGGRLYLAALSRTQLPVCHACHRAIHRGKDDGESLASIRERLHSSHAVA
jgi:hypothetical protein